MVKVEHEITTDERLADSIETLAAAIERFSDSFDRLTFVIEDLASRLGLETA